MSKLLDYCHSEQQRQLVMAVEEHGSINKASKALGVDRANATKKMQIIKLRAAQAGYSPDHDMTHEVAPGYAVKGISTMYDDEGNVKLQWVKTNQDAEQMAEAMREAVEAFASELPKCEPVKVQNGQAYMKNLLNQYTVTDYHLGMKAWDEECGDNWDTDIAEKLLVDWFAMAIALSPKAEKAILAQLGDFLHWDGIDAVTQASGHLLDADTRFQRVIRVAIRVTRKIIAMLLEKHKSVHVIMAEGNHDPASSMWLREMTDAHYENEPRVTVDTSPVPYYAYKHGEQALFYHHGHKKGVKDLDKVFAGMFREIFGSCKYADGHTGHYHHDEANETALMRIFMHRTLAANDAYGARGGYLSGRDAKVITYHDRFGEVGKITISPDMVNK